MRRLSGHLGLIYSICLSAGFPWVVRFAAKGPAHVTAALIVSLLALAFVAMLFSIVVHELGHALAVRLTGGRGRVTDICFFGPPVRVTLQAGTVTVGLGLRPRGQVSYLRDGLSVPRQAIITAAGPAANLLSAPLFFLLPLPHWTTVFLALLTVLSGLQDLAPQSDATDTGSDGAKLARVRAQIKAAADIQQLLALPDWSLRSDAADRLIDGYRLDVSEAEDCLLGPASQPDLLLRLYPQPWTLPDHPEARAIRAIHHLSWKVLTVPGLAPVTVDVAATRVEWVLAQLEKAADSPALTPFNARHTLAVARLRQGRPEDVRRLCAGALAADLTPAARATVLATVAMAKHALLLSGRQSLDEALALAPEADLVAEAVSFLDAATPAGSRIKQPA